MTDFSFRIEFPQTGQSPAPIVFRPGVQVIYGESGVGKSELCRQLVLTHPSSQSGNLVVQDRTPIARPMLVTQDPDDQIVAPSLFRELAFNLENLGWSSLEIEQRMAEIIGLAELTWNLDRHPFSLSGGECQMLNLATALSVRPDLLAIDDGLAFLSESNKQRCAAILQAYSEETEAVIVWMTSDHEDLRYGKERWELRAGSLSRGMPSMNPSSFNGRFPSGRATLKIGRLTFGYEERGNRLFRNQNLWVGPFRSLAILGDNGSGKTTLGRLLSGIVSPEEGTIDVELGGRRELRVGFLPQFPERLFGGRTLLELEEELRANGLFSNPDADTMGKVLGEFGISHSGVGGRPIHSLDVPVRRVALTLMICLARYDLVILDEPMFGLGIIQREKLLKHLRKFLSKKHLIFITHSPSAAEDLCDSAVTIEGGVIKELPLREEK
ncbi:MAG: ATP-binding cassette domain-containing protein [Fidelibacterota bacterium]